MRIYRLLPPVGTLLTLLLFSSCWLPMHAQPNEPKDDQLSRATKQAIEMAHSSTRGGLLTMWRRPDLEELLLDLGSSKTVGDIYFYEMQSPLQHSSDTPYVWIVAAVRSTQEVYEVYDFDAAQGPDAPLREFSRLVSKLGLSIPKDKAASFARLFLESCEAGEPREIVADAEGLQFRLAVESYYFAVYGDIWRALDSYVLWWQAFQATTPTFAPTIRADDNGDYRVTLKRLVMIAGRHPQVQDLELEISPEGTVRVLAMHPIFPKQPRSLFYDVSRTGPIGLHPIMPVLGD